MSIFAEKLIDMYYSYSYGKTKVAVLKAATWELERESYRSASMRLREKMGTSLT